MRNIRLSATAKIKLSKEISSLGAISPVLAVVMEKEDKKKILGVGIYERENLGESACIEEIDGMLFYLDSSMDGLANKTIDYVDGRFTLTE